MHPSLEPAWQTIRSFAWANSGVVCPKWLVPFPSSLSSSRYLYCRLCSRFRQRSPTQHPRPASRPTRTFEPPPLFVNARSRYDKGKITNHHWCLSWIGRFTRYTGQDIVGQIFLGWRTRVFNLIVLMGIGERGVNCNSVASLKYFTGVINKNVCAILIIITS